MIREAVFDDIPRLVEMGRRFHASLGIGDIVPFIDDDAATTFATLIEQENSTILVAEVDGAVIGAAGAMIYPFYFNFGHVTGQEFFWWVEPEHRGVVGKLLLEGLEQWASSRAQSFTMIVPQSLRPKAVAAIYERRGYRPSEATYIRSF